VEGFAAKEEQVNTDNHISVVHSEEEQFISDDPSNLFFKVPNRVVTHIEGCPSYLAVFSLQDQDKTDSLLIRTKPPPGTTSLPHFQIEVTNEKIMRYVEREGFPADLYEEQLYSIRSRQTIITRAICNYISRNIIITNLEMENNRRSQVKQAAKPFAMPKGPDTKTESFGLFDINGTNRRRKLHYNIIDDNEFNFQESQVAFENRYRN